MTTSSSSAPEPTNREKRNKALKTLIKGNLRDNQPGLPGMQTGDIAQLKRERDIPPPAFWKLWNALDLQEIFLSAGQDQSPKNREEAWAQTMQALASLRPAGPPPRELPHDDKIKLGAALRGKEERPTASELRVGQLLSAPYNKRAALMQRLVPLLKGQKFDLIELGSFLFDPSDAACRQIARAYYR